MYKKIQRKKLYKSVRYAFIAKKEVSVVYVINDNVCDTRKE